MEKTTQNMKNATIIPIKKPNIKINKKGPIIHAKITVTGLSGFSSNKPSSTH